MNQRIMLTKKLLKTSLTELLQQQDIYHVSIRELCENAGINRSTFYKYYGSQFDLLKEMEDDLLDAIASFLSSQDDTDSIDNLAIILHYLEGDLELVRLLFNANVDPEFPNRLFSLTPIQSMLKELFGDTMPPNEYAYCISFLIHGAFQMVCMWINKDTRESSDWMAALLVKHIKIDASKYR